jgi:hypothetical protein
MENTAVSFNDSFSSDVPPETFSVYLKALWYDRKGNWNKAHSLVDHLEGNEAARVHAYLHRKEGDSSNAGYWYRQAGISQPELSLEKEWEMLVTHFTVKPSAT